MVSSRGEGDNPNAHDLPTAPPDPSTAPKQITGASLDLAGTGGTGVDEKKGEVQAPLEEEGRSPRRQRRDGVIVGGLEGGASSAAIPRSAVGFVGDVGQAALLPKVVMQGVEVPLDAPIEQLWAALRHPDHFLYIVVRKR